jgi:Trypsin
MVYINHGDDAQHNYPIVVMLYGSGGGWCWQLLTMAVAITVTIVATTVAAGPPNETTMMAHDPPNNNNNDSINDSINDSNINNESSPSSLLLDSNHEIRHRRTSQRRLQQQQQKRIVGGKPAAANQFPFFAVPAGTKLCGATLIHSDVLLSAAHCQGAFLDMGVLIGATQLDGSDVDEFVGVVLEQPHPRYQPGTEQNDIMLVKLVRPSRAPLVDYNVNASVPGPSDGLNVIGFGRTSTDGPSASTLQQVPARLVPNDECAASLQAQGFIVDAAIMLCTGAR